MEKKIINTFDEAVEYLYDTPRFTSKNTIEDTRAFLDKLGSPDKNMKIIHVAGTNGKGSVCSYIRSVLEAAGYKTALFTSPHLIDIRERFLIDGKMVSKEEFLEVFLVIYDLLDWKKLSQNEGYHPTFFEYIFFIGMLLFEKHPVDYVILETGLGGRLDATNCVLKKELSVITRISLEHTQYLGDTIEKIAGEKAGIIARDTPLVFWDTNKEVRKVFADKAEKLNAPYISVSDKDYRLMENKHKSIDFSLRTRYYDYIELTLSTSALYQLENASIAVKAIEAIDKGEKICAKHIYDGIKNCHWSGRMEEVLPNVYVDGAHNEDGIRAFLETVGNDGFSGRRILLFGVMKDKDYSSMINQIKASGLFESICPTKVLGERALDSKALKALFENSADDSKKEDDFKQPVNEPKICAYDDYDTALDDLLPLAENTRLYIAGSLYLVGEVLSKLKN